MLSIVVGLRFYQILACCFSDKFTFFAHEIHEMNTKKMIICEICVICGHAFVFCNLTCSLGQNSKHRPQLTHAALSIS